MTSTQIAIAYGRCSTDRQDQSIEVQHDAMTRFAAANGLTLPKEFIFLEDDTSGSTPFASRVKGGHVMRQLKEGKARVLVVPKIDRLGRDALDVQNTIQWIHRLGPDYRIYILDLGGSSFDTRSPIGGMIIAMLSWFAQFELARIRERIKNVLDHKRSKGELTGTIPYGWNAEPTGQVSAKGVSTRKLVRNETEQLWIRTMVNWRALGWSYARIATELNSRNVAPKIPKGTPLNQHGTKRQLRFASGKWSSGGVQHVLSNKKTQELLSETASAQPAVA